MSTMDGLPEITAPDQAAGYLQITRETVYRYIRNGKLLASKLGRSYRIPKRNLDLLLLSTLARPDITLREYSAAEIEDFLVRDRLDDEATAIAHRFAAIESPTARRE